jgi:hypothetical protein
MFPSALFFLKKNNKSLSTLNIYLNIDCRMPEAEFASGQKRAQLVQKLAGTVHVRGVEGQVNYNFFAVIKYLSRELHKCSYFHNLW